MPCKARVKQDLEGVNLSPRESEVAAETSF